MRKLILIMLIGVSTMAVFANTIKGFMPGNINRQNVTQDQGSFGTYIEQERVLNTKNGPKTVYDTGFVKTLNDTPFDMEKASEMPIKPKLNFTHDQLMERIFNPNNRSKLEVKVGNGVTYTANIKLPQVAIYP